MVSTAQSPTIPETDVPDVISAELAGLTWPKESDMPILPVFENYAIIASAPACVRSRTSTGR